MIYTSYYWYLNVFPENFIPVAISRNLQSGYKGYHYKPLAPTFEIGTQWKKSGDNERYKTEYRKILKGLKPNKVISDLYKFIPKDFEQYNIVLISFERPNEFSHRELLREWLNENNIECQEWINPNKFCWHKDYGGL